MKLRVNKIKKEIIDDIIQKYKLDISIKYTFYDNCILMSVDADTADILRDSCSDYLLESGFDSNYSPNALGLLLEELIDQLF